MPDKDSFSRSRTSKSNSLLRNIALYGAFGCLASGTDALMFYLLTYQMQIAALQANLISVPVGIAISFVLNRRYNFKVTDHAMQRASIFFGVGILGLCLSQAILWLGTSWTIEPLCVKLASIIIVAAFQFSANKLISFGIKFE